MLSGRDQVRGEQVVKEIRAAGYPLLAYTVNHAGRAQELFGWGVSAVFTDAPDQVIRAL